MTQGCHSPWPAQSCCLGPPHWLRRHCQDKSKATRLPIAFHSEYLAAAAKVPHLPQLFLSPSLRPAVPGTLSLGPFLAPAGSCTSLPGLTPCRRRTELAVQQGQGLRGQRGLHASLSDWQTMGARGPERPPLPAHLSAGPEGPGRTYQAPKLATNSSSA